MQKEYQQQPQKQQQKQRQKQRQKDRNKLCQNCFLYKADNYFPLVVSAKQTDIFSINNNNGLSTKSQKANNLCNQCKQQFIKIEKLVIQNNLKFGSGSIKGRQMVSIYINFTKSLNNSNNNSVFNNQYGISNSCNMRKNSQLVDSSIKSIDKNSNSNNNNNSNGNKSTYSNKKGMKISISKFNQNQDSKQLKQKQKDSYSENQNIDQQQQEELQSNTANTNYNQAQQLDSQYQTSKLPISYNLLNSYDGYDPQYHSLYNQTIQNIIKQVELYKSSFLPNNYKYLMYLCGKQINPSQRHQRVRSTLLRVMVGHGIKLSQIKNVSILVQILLCFMRDAEVYIIIGKLWESLSQGQDEIQNLIQYQNQKQIKIDKNQKNSKKDQAKYFIPNNSQNQNQFQNLIQQQDQKQSVWKFIFSKVKAFEILILVNDVCKDGVQGFQKYLNLKQDENQFKIKGKNKSTLRKSQKSKAMNSLANSQIVHFDSNNQAMQDEFLHNQFNFKMQNDSMSYLSPHRKASRRMSIPQQYQQFSRQQLAASFSGQPSISNQNYFQTQQFQNNFCPYCSNKYEQNHNQNLKQIERMKNYCKMIIDSIMKEQQKYKAYIKEIQTKFKKQKDEYITKILTLKNKLSINTDQKNKLMIMGQDGKSQAMQQGQQEMNNIIQIQNTILNQKNLKRKQSLSKAKDIYLIDASKSMTFTNQRFIFNKRIISTNQNFNKFQSNPLMQEKQKISEKESINNRNSLDSQIQNKKRKQIRQKSQSQECIVPISLEVKEAQQPKQQRQKQTRQLFQSIQKEQQRQSQKLQQILLTYLNKILIQTQILPLPQVILSPQQFLQNIIQQISKIQEQNTSYLSKLKQNDTQIRRLLSIIQRKQEKFVPLMHQKDQLIQTYQNALWRLENGLSMSGNKLADRIQLIQKLERQRVTQKQKEKQRQKQRQKAKKKENTIQVISKKNQKPNINQKKQQIKSDKSIKQQKKQTLQQTDQLKTSLKKKPKKSKIQKASKEQKKQQSNKQQTPPAKKQKSIFSSSKKDSTKQNCIIY